MGSLERILHGEDPDEAREGGGVTIPPGLELSPEIDMQIVSSFWRGVLQQAKTPRQQQLAVDKLADNAIRFTAAQTGAQAQAAVARATPQKEPVVYAQPRPRELPERSGEKAAPSLTEQQERFAERITTQIEQGMAAAFAPPTLPAQQPGT